MWRRALVVAGVLALTACSPLSPAHIVDPASSHGLEGQWRLIDGKDGGGPLDLEGASVTLTIEGGSFFGEGPCNSYRGTVTEGVRVVDFSDLASTMRGCDPAELGVLESRYFAALDAVEAGGLSGERLSLSGVSGPLTHSPVRLVFESLD
jgi:heat shock protein HslJ